MTTLSLKPRLSVSLVCHTRAEKGACSFFLSISEIRLLETISEDFVKSFVCWLHVSLNMYKGVHLVAEHCLYTSS